MIITFIIKLILILTSFKNIVNAIPKIWMNEVTNIKKVEAKKYTKEFKYFLEIVEEYIFHIYTKILVCILFLLRKKRS